MIYLIIFMGRWSHNPFLSLLLRKHQNSNDIISNGIIPRNMGFDELIMVWVSGSSKNQVF